MGHIVTNFFSRFGESMWDNVLAAILVPTWKKYLDRVSEKWSPAKGCGYLLEITYFSAVNTRFQQSVESFHNSSIHLPMLLSSQLSSAWFLQPTSLFIVCSAFSSWPFGLFVSLFCFCFFFSNSWHNTGAPGSSHGTEGAHLHCGKQGGPVH